MSGRGTAAGVDFQAVVGAHVAALMLAERPMSRLAAGLPGHPRKVLFETPAAVDDVLVLTDVGEIYVQAKSSLPLSALPTSELASVADQFVRQFRAGVTENGARRELDPTRDRLVLAVSGEAPDTIAKDLREVLDRLRTGAATGLPQKLVAARDTFAGQLATAWQAAARASVTDAERDDLLELCAVVEIASAHRQLAEEALTDVVAQAGAETAVMDLIERWAVDASKAGVGGDAPHLRQALAGKATFKAPPSYAADVEKLRGRLVKWSEPRFDLPLSFS